MNTKKIVAAATLAGVLSFSLSTQTTSAASLFSFVENSSGVVGTLSGSLDLTGDLPMFPSNGPYPDQIHPAWGTLGVSLNNTPHVVYFAFGPAPFGSGGQTFATSGSGSPFGMEAFFSLEAFALAADYQGGPLNATLTFDGATFASLGITPGTYVYNFPNDIFTLQFGPAPAPTPIPGALALFLTGLSALGLIGRRAKKAASLASKAGR